MFDYRLKDVFTDYVNNDDFIFNRINNNGITEKMVNYKDWNNIDDNTIVYFSLDDYTLLYGRPYDEATGSNVSYYYYFGYLVKRDSTRTVNYYGTLYYTNSDKMFSFRFASQLDGGGIGSFIQKFSVNDIVIIDGKRYIPIKWEQERFFNILSYYGGMQTEILDYNLIENTGYFLKEEQTIYPWCTSTMDFEYIYSHSGDKLIAPLVYKLLEDDKTITSQNLDKIVNIIKNKYIDKWNKLYQALVIDDYNPIENYSMVEVETPNITKTYHREQNTNIEVSDDGESTSSVYGFNSSTPTPSGKAEVDNTRTTSGNKDDNFQDGNDTETGTREKTRSGNIGVTTTQQMLEQEIEIKKHNFYDIVYGDIDNVITLEIY